MRAKGYFGIIIIILVVFGLRPAQDSAPNQQIVLQFNESNTTTDVAETALANVKQQLVDAGAYNIKVESLVTGQLKITYYSTFNVEHIKDLLSDETLGYTSQNESEEDFPSNENYNLDIFEIQNGIDTDTGFDGVFVFSHNQKYDPSVNPTVNSFVAITENNIDNLVQVAFQISLKITNGLDNISHEIPEVRAGPKV